ncbi:hypothetical protein AX15_007751 [Amanita polypyramis BW_CC]|nr:hypothetical protein AX15_007751 [Amanita polypyramis BW_CC]
MSTKYKGKTQVIAYINKKMSKNHFISIDETTFGDPNILLFSIAKTNNKGQQTSFCSFINVYAHPSSNGTITRRALIRNLLKVSKNVVIIQGDFNLHLSIWDELCRSETSTAGVNLYTSIVEENFQLINKDDKPTWYRDNDIPRVLDLLFVNNNLGRQDLQDNFKLIGEKFDHRTLTLNLKQGRRVSLGRPYIKGESEEEFSFLQDILNDVPFWTCLANAQEKTTRLMEGITKAFDKYAKRPKINSKPTMWWTDTCRDRKEDYAQQPCKQTRAAYYKAI